GWASYWHSTIMTQRALEPNEVVDYADHHAGTMGTSPGQLNPYKLGMELLRDIEERWNKGQFGRDWEECDDMRERANWDKQLGLGRQKVFEVRKLYNDVTFIDTFLTPEFCGKHQLFVYRYNPHRDVYEISNRDFDKIKRQLLFSLTNFGQPIVDITDANHANRGELYLAHRHEGVDLELGRSRDTLHNLRRIWGRPVHLETIVTGHRVLLSYGEEFSAQDIGRS
ncbi:MAG: SpoVR family protein, partial [Deinococcus sp.]|nr:SpoVR family protein [Deinococcus sp.]